MPDLLTRAPWRNRIIGSGVLKVAEALANPLNFRVHPAHQRAALETSLDNVGWVQQVVVNTKTGNLLDGHLRLALAEQRGEQELPCLYVDLDAEEERLVLASLDPIASMATADRVRLTELLASIQSEDEGVRALLESIARQERLELPALTGLVDPDSLPETPEEPVSRTGDLWLLDPHRLLCGDSTNPEDVGRLMAGERAVGMFTDPPYLVDYDGGNHPQTWKDGKKVSAEDKTRHWDAYTDHAGAVEFYANFLKVALDQALVERPVLYQFFGMMRVEIVLEAWRANQLLAHQILIWHKSRPVLSRCWYMYDFEPFVVGWVKGKQPEVGLRPPNNAVAVWDCDQKEGVEQDLGAVHPTIKPVELIRRPILYHSRPGELIYEPFSGSGTALIAAELTGRRCCAVELSPQFVDVCVLRWQRLSGRQAILEGDGRSFAEVADERLSGNASQGNAGESHLG
jgi:DNA modification methylase